MRGLLSRAVAAAAALLLQQSSGLRFPSSTGRAVVRSHFGAASVHGRGRSVMTMEAVGLSIRPSVKLIFVGGKGGVGKTSVSCAIALKYADAGERTLVVSTDPAHSLGDALMQELSSKPVNVDGDLYAMEVDADAAMADWRTAIESFDAEKLAERYGNLGVEAVKSLGVDEFVELLATPPPGVDELVALANVLKYAEDEGFERVIVDTAPTGHALRLLDLPQFADGFLDKLVMLKSRVGGLAKMASGMFGDNTVGTALKDMDDLTSKLEGLRVTMRAAREKLGDPEKTEFVVVALPTELSVSETERLADALTSESSGGGVSLRSVVLNRVVPATRFGEASVKRLAERQRAVLDRELKIAPLSTLELTEVPTVETAELVGFDALRYLASLAFQEWDTADFSKQQQTKLVVVGGKGGVGKTTISSSLALWLADSGLNTAIVSTDPAHSLGDALGTRLIPGEISDLEPFCGASLTALEIDGDGAAAEAADILADSLGVDANEDATGDAASALRSLGEVLKTPPPGVDELVALLKVYDIIKSKKFDVLVLDTAPTGHTLRLLALPELLDDFAERAIRARNRLQANPLLGAFMKRNSKVDDATTELKDRLADLQDRAFALDAMLHDDARAQFVIVAAPTDLSLAESRRLKSSLDDSEIPSKRLVVNGVLPMTESSYASYSDRARKTQAISIKRVNQIADRLKLDVITLPQFDSDINGVDGLRALSMILHKDAA